MNNPKIEFVELNLENFGPFNGDLNHIHFSATEDKNITYFLGEVGSGKTTIFQSIWWVLFPEQKNTDDSKIREKEVKFLKNQNIIYAVNKKAIRDAKINEEIPFSVEIKILYYDHVGNKTEYIVKRQQKYIKKRDTDTNDVSNIEYIAKSDEIKISENAKDKMDINQFYEIIDSVLPQGVREFIFIHGEGLTNLFMHSGELIKKCALEMSDEPKIKALEIYLGLARDYFFDQRKTVDSENNKLNELNKQIGDLETEINNLKDRIDEIDKSIQGFNSDIQENKTLLNQIAEERVKMHELKDLNELKEKLKNKKEKAVQDREKYLRENLPYLYLEDVIGEILKDLEKKHEKGILPGRITKESLEEVLEHPIHCICGIPWDVVGEMKKNIMKKFKNVPVGLLGGEVTEFEIKVKDIQANLDDIKVNIWKNEQDLGKINQKINQNNGKISEIKKALGSDQQEEKYINEIINIEKKVKENEDTIKVLIGKRGVLQGQIVVKNEELTPLKKDYTTKKKKTRKKDEVDYEFYMNSIDEMKTILIEMKSIISEEIRQSVEKLTIDIIKKLAKDPDNWKEIRVKNVDDSWILEAINLKETKIENQSTGQTKILAVSFIFSLSEILGIDLPMVFDSPFVNLDPETRTQVISNISGIYKDRQVIFFIKSSELSGLFDDKIGKYEDLRPILDHYSDCKYNIDCENNELTVLIKG